jgi:ketosteroid isomerase-like protein
MQTERTILDAARRLDEALQAGDRQRVLSCFSEDCELEVLEVRLSGIAGVTIWPDWVFAHAASIRFVPRLVAVHGSSFVEEFTVDARLHDGRRLASEWAEVLEFRENRVTSLRLYFNPLDFLEAEGRFAGALAPAIRRFARRGLRSS